MTNRDSRWIVISKIPVVELWNISKRYRIRYAIVGLSLMIYDKEIFCLTGPNGSGKTTVAKILSGLVLPSSGGGHVLGYDIYRDNVKIREKVGYVPERIRLFSFYSVYENLLFLARLRGLGGREVDEVIDAFQLGRYRDSKPDSLGAFELKKVAIAAAMMGDPKLIVLDEPFRGLDDEEVEEMRKIILDLNRRHLKTVFYTVNNVAYALGLASRYTSLSPRTVGRRLPTSP